MISRSRDRQIYPLVLYIRTVFGSGVLYVGTIHIILLVHVRTFSEKLGCSITTSAPAHLFSVSLGRGWFHKRFNWKSEQSGFWQTSEWINHSQIWCKFFLVYILKPKKYWKVGYLGSLLYIPMTEIFYNIS